MFKHYSNEYQFKDIAFTDEEMIKYNLLAIHQDSFVHQEQDNFVHSYVDDEKNSSSNVKDKQIFDMKNEWANVRAEMLKFQKKVLDEISNNQKKVDKQFTEVKQYVAESVKTILNELRSAGIKSDEFNEDRKNDSRSVDDLLQTPNESKICEQIPNEPIKVKDELSRDMAFEMDVCGDIGGAKSSDNLSPLKKLSFFTESQLITLEPTFRKLELPKSESQILLPVIFDKSPLIMHQHYGSTHEKSIIYFNKKHPFEDYVGFEVPDILVDQFTNWCYAKKVSEK
ncbi:putative protein isoform X2 [Capsicum galapagoense]